MRRRHLSALFLSGLLASRLAAEPAPPPAESPTVPPKTVAAIVTTYYHNSHADILVSRLLQHYTLDGQGPKPQLKLLSLYTDQVPDNDISRRLMAEFKIPIYPTIKEALTLGGDKLAVDGILLIGEHGKYPRNEWGNIMYPKRRLFTEILAVLDASQRVVPVFSDKHLADTWEDAKWFNDQARQRQMPLMAGSVLPVLWRQPAADVPAGAELKEIVALSYHTLDAYGFHALELTQALAERRKGGETGIKAVRCLKGEAVWQALADGTVSADLFAAALKAQPRLQNGTRTLQEAVKEPTLMTLDYQDGLRAHVVTLNGAVAHWTAAWRLGDGTRAATYFHTQEARPFMHFSYQLQGIEAMMHSGQPAWPAERTLLTSGALDALLRSLASQGQWRATPELSFAYTTKWQWQQPPPPPPDRPIKGQ